MPDADEQMTAAKAKAYLVDPASMLVLWMNESASDGLPDAGASEVALDEAFPIGATLGLSEAVAFVAGTGTARHLQTDLVSTSLGTMRIVVSVYRVPDGSILVLSENAWEPAHKSFGASRARRPGR
ncbi:MAG: hypothetical protein WBI63_03935 [Coriobacteriia bacterium]